MATPTFWLNSNSLFELTSTADWAPVQAWETDETGKRRPSRNQALDSQNLPIWEIRVIARQDFYGRAEELFLNLRTASAQKPGLDALSTLGVIA